MIKKLRGKILNYRMKLAVNLLRSMNRGMKKMGWSRQRRRQFWRDFSKSPTLQEEIFDGFMNN